MKVSRRLFAVAAFFFCALAAGIYHHLLKTGTCADPVILSLAGLPWETRAKVFFFHVDAGDQRKLLPRMTSGPAFAHEVRGQWVRTLHVSLPAANLPDLAAVTIHIGNEVFSFQGDDVRRSWRRRLPENQAGGRDIILEVPDVFERRSALFGAPLPVWNWPGDAAFLARVWKVFFTPALLIGLFLFFLSLKTSSQGVTWGRQFLGLEPSAVTERTGERKWHWVGWLFLVGALAFLEVREPFYFTQDDNMVDSLPMMLVGCRSVWEGRLPNYNPYLFLGAPLANLGLYALTYPPTYLSYGLARHVLGNEYATVEVFAVLHLAAGFWAMRLLCGKVGMSALSANLAALSFVLSGSMLIVGRSWFSFLPLAVWLPLLFMGLVELGKKPASWKWFLGMGLASGLPFHVGFSQLAIYANGFVALAALYLALVGSLPWKRVLALVPVFVLGAGIALPLVYQQWRIAADIHRAAAPDVGIGAELAGFFLPYPLVQAQAPTGWGNVNPQCMGHLYFCGGLLAILFAMQVVSLIVFRPSKGQWGGFVWTFCGLIALWLSLGDGGGLWTLLSRLPVIGFIQRFPMRLLPFVIFFASLGGGLTLERVLGMWHGHPRRKTVLACVALGMLGWHLGNCRTAFYSFGFRPYPPLPVEVEDKLRSVSKLTGRVITWSPVRSRAPHYVSWLSNNLPAVYRLPSLDGYNSLLEGKPIVQRAYEMIARKKLEALRAYGVRWHVLPPKSDGTDISTAHHSYWWQEVITLNDELMWQIRPDLLDPAYDGKEVLVTDALNCDPLAFTGDKLLALEAHGEGIDVTLPPSEKSRVVVVNFLHYPEMQASVDGQPVVCTGDEWNRIVVRVAAGGGTLAIRYVPPWGRGLAWGVAVMGLGAVLALGVRESRHHAPRDESAPRQEDI